MGGRASMPGCGIPTLGDARPGASGRAARLFAGHGVGDGIEWHGARFEVRAMQGERITSVGLSLLPAPVEATA